MGCKESREAVPKSKTSKVTTTTPSTTPSTTHAKVEANDKKVTSIFFNASRGRSNVT